MHPQTNTYLPTRPDTGKAGDTGNTGDTAPTRPRLGTDLGIAALAVVAALLTWGIWTQLAGVELAAHTGDSVRTVGAAGVALSTAAIALVGIATLRILERRWRRGLAGWSALALAVLVLSFPGPIGATTLAAGLGLASLHLVVGVVVLVGLRRVRMHT